MLDAFGRSRVLGLALSNIGGGVMAAGQDPETGALGDKSFGSGQSS